jgi:hypothetical protein
VSETLLPLQDIAALIYEHRDDVGGDFEDDDWVVRHSKCVADCADIGGELLCKLAFIPPPGRKQFLDEVARVLATAYIQNSIQLPPEIMRVVVDIEKNIRAAYSALLTLPLEWRPLLYTIPDPPLPSIVQFDFSQIAQFEQTLERMIKACSMYTGKSPRVMAKSGKRGRRRNDRTKTAYPLKVLIWRVGRAVKRCGGRLTLDRANKRGTWIDALNGLRPLFPEGFIPNALPLSAIEELQARSNRLSRLNSKFLCESHAHIQNK